jgi:hypothetical protein
MRHKWNKEERKADDGRAYHVTICVNCRMVKEKAWTGYLYYKKGYDPVKNNSGPFTYRPGNCNVN